ncbi:M24 family metallopeptidase [Shewanella mesophila]|uniref:M24 family metallopeptidase n=1 Tax=Shewanella mesophila TaxID=2864208 RepID=UPI0033134114
MPNPVWADTINHADTELNHYASHIRRRYPVNGKFSAAQARVSQIVLNALNNAIAQVKPAWKRCMKPACG